MARTRTIPGQLRTGNDRNAYGITAGGSHCIFAMKSSGSFVRTILTVGILILALPFHAFKGVFRQVQRKCMLAIRYACERLARKRPSTRPWLAMSTITAIKTCLCQVVSFSPVPVVQNHQPGACPL